MKIYLVGGAVRDEIMGRDVHDRDYVVVGSTHQEMIDQGFTQVGASFPVYLHPVTKEEYALARTERRTGDGHRGFETFFDPTVTIEQDLARRDLTVNAIAKDLETGEFIDPFDGIEDITNKHFCATTEAFEEDPLRILRLFRFMSQFGPDWRVSVGTKARVEKNIHRLAEITPERKWKEFQKALESDNPELFIEGMVWAGQLPAVEALRGVPQPAEHHPEGDAYEHTMLCIKAAARNGLEPDQVFAMMCHDLGKAITFRERGNLHGHEAAGLEPTRQLCDEFKVPNHYRKLALTVTEVHGKIHASETLKPSTLFELLKKMDVEKRDGFFDKVVDCALMDSWGRGPTRYGEKYLPAIFLRFLAMRQYCSSELSEKARAIADKHKGNGDLIRELVRAEKIQIVRTGIHEWNKRKGVL